MIIQVREKSGYIIKFSRRWIKKLLLLNKMIIVITITDIGRFVEVNLFLRRLQG